MGIEIAHRAVPDKFSALPSEPGRFESPHAGERRGSGAGDRATNSGRNEIVAQSSEGDAPAEPSPGLVFAKPFSRELLQQHFQFSINAGLPFPTLGRVIKRNHTVASDIVAGDIGLRRLGNQRLAFAA